MIAAPLEVGARGIDSEPWSSVGDLKTAQALKASGIDFVSLYLGTVTPEIVANVLAAGLAFVPVTYANQTDGAKAVAQLKALGIPEGVTVFLDVEGASTLTDPAALWTAINAWADALLAAGYVPGIYVGSPQPFTSNELYMLHVERYWRAPSRVLDRFGALAEPMYGWCAFQAWPSVTWAGIWVDVDFCYQDYKQRTVVGAAQ